MTRVTVAICTYNRAKTGYLEQAIQSVLNQVYKDMNIIVYDNGSTDNTCDVVSTFIDPRLTYVRISENTPDIFNIILSECKTEYIIIFHDDDIMLPHMVETEVRILDKYPNAAIIGQIFSPMMTIDSNGKALYKHIPILNSLTVFNKCELIKNNLKYGSNIIVCPSVMFRISFVNKFNFKFDIKCGPAVDWLLWLQINMNECQIILVKEFLLKYRVHPESGTHYSNKTGAFLDSFFYIEKWLVSNEFTNTQMLKEKFISHAIMPFGKKLFLDEGKITDITAYLSELSNQYSWQPTHRNTIAEGLLHYSINMIIKKEMVFSQYFKLRHLILHNFQSSPSLIQELKWILKLLIYNL